MNPPRNEGRWAGQLALVLVVISVIVWYVQARRAPVQLLERRDCENAYAAARTSADTLAVDARQPLGASRPDSLRITCGTLRHTGRL
ncbi:MAG TPA: hypothetical protein VG454_13070 [Gemmatimonadales bacterium]|nr:hypothetical protein [Gemmatimonadales bacterium]